MTLEEMVVNMADRDRITFEMNDGEKRLNVTMTGPGFQAETTVSLIECRDMLESAMHQVVKRTITDVRHRTGPRGKDWLIPEQNLGWRPIETAPKDATFLAWVPVPKNPHASHYCICCYAANPGVETWWDIRASEIAKPTYWRPLPDHP
jgi:hypothetical protein